MFPQPFRIGLSRFALVVAGSLAMLTTAGCEKSNSQAAQVSERPPTEVTIVTLQSQAVALTTELPGRAVALRKAEVRPQISGIVEKRLFEEGAQVEAGQQLYQIDAARYQAALQTAKANLRRAEADLNTATTRQQRYQNLLTEKAVSQQQYDDTAATFEQAKAEVAVAQAAVQTAEIDLAYTRVIAPISGRIGKSSVTEGALLSAQQAGVLATIHQLDPIYVDLAQPAKNILALRRQMLDGNLSQTQGANVHLTLEDGSVYEHTGQLKFSEMSVNESTGTVSVRASFPNPDYLLLPGMFVRATIEDAVREDAVLVPQRGVTRDRQGHATAMIVNAQNQIEARILETNRAVGDNWLVDNGLEVGDRVVVEGLQKIAPGAPVTPVEQSEIPKQAEG